MKILLLLLITSILTAQNTVGVLAIDLDRVQSGFSLFTPNNQSTTFLINNCGQVVNKWEHGINARLGAEQYLLPDGNLLVAKSDFTIVSSPSIGAGGAGGVIEIRSWDDEILWQHIIQDSLQRQHHDIHMMPNGNILAIAWDRYYLDDMVSMGFDTSELTQIELWPDKIVEIDTALREVVWEWKVWDHLIQDSDSTKSNFGVVHDHPERININYQEFTFGKQDWIHSNSIDYNPELDQILISARNFNEIWIIDHSTTIEEASTTSGGNSGKGGDLLFRWGNPKAYKKGGTEDQSLFYQHDASWIDDSDLKDSEYFNMISVFNNFIDLDLSLGAILDPYGSHYPAYSLDSDSLYLPNTLYRTISHPDTLKQYSTSASNFQLLPNGNFLLHAARQGRTLELTDSEDPVWEYLIPIRNGYPVAQGDNLALSDNFTFSLRKYASDYSAFLNKDLKPKGFLESNPDENFCILTNLNDIESLDDLNITLSPIPAFDRLFINTSIKVNERFGLYFIVNSFGAICQSTTEYIAQEGIDLSNFDEGIYYIFINNRMYPFIKLH